MRNMNLTPRPRDLTALLNSDRTDTAIPEPVDTEKPNTAIPNTEKTKTGRTKTGIRGGLGEDQREPSRLDPTPAQDLGRRARHAHPGGIGGRSGLVPVLTHRSP